MREIKFRAWDTDEYRIFYSIAISQNGYAEAPWGKEKPGWILMQYTGFHDKNGKEIYEGDVVTCYWEAGGEYNAREDCPVRQKVEWDMYVCGFAPFAHYDSDCGQYVVMSGVEVLGNIYENPELLNEA